MAHLRSFRFGVQLNQPLGDRTWAETARYVESLGYDSLHLPDHFGDQLAPMPAMMAAAAATTRLKVGALVLDNDYKHPVVTAKELATIDVLSGGRVEVGLGAGWMTSDYEQSGIPLDPPGVRVSRMEESIAVMKGLFSDDTVHFDGDHYQLSGLEGTPKPVQRPHPPFLIGGGGKRVLSIAAQEADIVGINPSMKAGVVGPDAAADATAEATDRKVGWVREVAGDRWERIEINMLVLAAILTDDRSGTAAMMAELFGSDAESVLEVPHVWIGTEDAICADLQARRDRWGASYYVLQGDACEAMAPVIQRLTGT